jgi:hypothetical protein
LRLSLAEAQISVRRGLTDEDLALLGHSDLAEESPDVNEPVEHGYPAPAGFRERLILGDISW